MSVSPVLTPEQISRFHRERILVIHHKAQVVEHFINGAVALVILGHRAADDPTQRFRTLGHKATQSAMCGERVLNHEVQHRAGGARASGG